MAASGADRGLERALDVANRTVAAVPGYQRHLHVNGRVKLPVSTPGSFTALPPVTKQNYLRAYPQNELVWDGDVTVVATWSSSSGSSGTPSYWPRSRQALDDSAILHDRIFSSSFQTRSRTTLVIDAFAMGMWIGGTYTYLAMLELRRLGHRLSVVTPGIDIPSIIDAIERLAPLYDQVVLAGYPPFVKDILDRTPDAALTRTRLNILLAGEAITEVWRDYALRRIQATHEPWRVCLIYGTADAGAIGHESPLSTEVRRAAAHDPALNQALFGANQCVQPTFVEYDPELRYVEIDEDGYFLFTVDTSLPLVRYRINDRGWTLTDEALRTALTSTGHVELARKVPEGSDFLVLVGRPDIAATFYSVNVYAEHLREAFEGVAVATEVTGKFVVETRTDDAQNQRLITKVELAKGAVATETLSADLRARCLDALCRNSSEFAALHAMLGTAAELEVELRPNQSPEFEVIAKHRWIGAPS